ncbi:MAG: aminotransferase class V-fold PLP-dependent enzyme [Pseudomonadota bacterium]
MQTEKPYDVGFIRAQFPAFSEPGLREHAFFENAGGSYTCRYVQWRLNRFYRERKMQPYSPYAPSRAGGDEMDEAQFRMARILGVDTHEVCFGPSTTQNTYVLAQAFRDWLDVGDAIIVTNQDHEANSGPWRRLAKHGVEVREWRIDPETGSLPLSGLDALLDNKVKLVCFPHCSNIVGEVNPVSEIVRRVKSVGAFACVDGVSYAPHGFPNVRKLGADIYLFSAYKTYGPHQGVMVISEDLGMALPNQGHYFNGSILHKRFTPAGPDHAQVAASAGMADYVEAVYDHHHKAGRDATGRAEVVHQMMRSYESSLLQPLLDYLGAKNSVRLIGPRRAQNRAPTVSIVTELPAMAYVAPLAEHGVMVGGGDFYANRLLDGLNIDPSHGVLRMSFVHYTEQAEIDRLMNTLDHVL